MIIFHNIIATTCKNRLQQNEKSSKDSLEKLSSGLKINKAADDASGLAISEKMRGQIRGFSQASHNIQDGIGLVQVADSALGSINDPLLQRMRELVVKAGNTILTSSDRQSLQDELDQLKQAIDMTAIRTNFNNITPLNKTAHPEFLLSSSATGTYQYDNILATPPVAANGSFLFATAQGYPTTTADDNKRLVFGAGGTSQPSAKIDGTEYTLVPASAGVSVTPTAESSGIYSTVFQINSANVTITQSVGIVQDKYEITYTVQNNDSTPHDVGILFNVDTMLGNDDQAPFIVDGTQISNATEYDGSAIPTGFTVFNHSGNPEIQATGILRGSGILQDPDRFFIGNYAAVQSWNWTPSGTVGDSGYSIIWDARPVAQGTTFSVNTFYGLSIPSTIADPTGNGTDAIYELKLQVGANTGNQYRIGLVDATAHAIGISDINVNTVATTGEALDKVDQAIQTISQWRSTFGTHQNALEHLIANVTNSNENLTSAESKIRDADMAKELMKYKKSNILSEAAQAMLAQANQQPQHVLSLLSNS